MNKFIIYKLDEFINNCYSILEGTHYIDIKYQTIIRIIWIIFYYFHYCIIMHLIRIFVID